MVTKEQVDAFRPEGMEDAVWEDLSSKFMELNQSDNNGLIMNNQDLKKEKQAVQEKLKAREEEFQRTKNENEQLNKQLADNAPDKVKDFYEQKLKEQNELLEGTRKDLTQRLEAKERENEELKQGVFQRDCMQLLNASLSGKNVLPGTTNDIMTLILGENCGKFARRDVGGDKEEILRKDGKTIAGSVDEFFSTDLGKRFLVNGNTGGGADGGRGASGSGKTLTRAEFDALPAREKAEKMRDGYKVTE